jgi:hypothetical protein
MRKPIQLFIGCLSVCAFLAFTIPVNRIVFFSFGKSECKINISGNPNSNIHFVSLHDNENTAIKAYENAVTMLSNTALFQVQQNEQRLIEMEFNGEKYYFDPNRIFSNIGIQKTLQNLQANYPPEAHKKVQAFADSLLELIIPVKQSTYVIAIHNNDNKGFSALSYLKNKDALKTNIVPEEDTDDFFIVTNEKDFIYFKSIHKNVVLQNPRAVDDGSLSVYCQKKQIPYINIETEHGHLKEQIAMIRDAYNYIEQKN